MRNRTTVASFLFLSLLIIIGSATGETRIVDDNEGRWVDFNTIQDAIDNANQSDTIRIYQGIYHEHVVLNKTLDLIGNGTQDSGIFATSDVGLTITAANCNISSMNVQHQMYFSGHSNVAIVNTTDVTMDDCYFNNGYELVTIDSSTNVLISNSTLSQGMYGIKADAMTYSAVLGSDFLTTYGIEMYASEHNAIFGCSFDGEFHAIMDYDGDSNTVTNNSFFSVSGIYLMSRECILTDNTFDSGGITIDGDGHVFWKYHTIINNTLDGSPITYWVDIDNASVPVDSSQVILAGCRNVTVTGLDIDSAWTGISLGYTGDCTVIGNTLINSGGIGIYSFYGYGDVIVDNTISGYGKGILGFYSHLVEIRENYITSASVGIHLSTTYKVAVESNDIVSNIHGMTLERMETYVNINGYTSITGNEIVDNGHGIAVDNLYSNTISGNTIANNTFKGVYLTNGSWLNKVTNNTFIKNGVNGYDDGLNNSWHRDGIGNNWSNYKGKDTNNDGIGDEPYSIPGNASALDEFPITTRMKGGAPKEEGYGEYLLVMTVVTVLVIVVVLIMLVLMRRKK